ncbi:MAG: NAD(+) synthase, partial [Pirellulales bacterium]
MHSHGFLRITAASHATTVADPLANRHAIEQQLALAAESDVILFPELALSGYTCGELFLQPVLLSECQKQLYELCKTSREFRGLIVVGLPWRIDGRLYNMAAAIQSGKLLGLVPKQYLPTYQEFYETRWFCAGDDSLPREIHTDVFGAIPCGIDLLLESGEAVIGIEICEDLWMPIPPSSSQALAGANVLLNLSASNETIGKAHYRRQLVSSQSGRCCAAYAYASSGPGESTTDLVFGGHCLIAENGSILAESQRVGDGLNPFHGSSMVTMEVDLQRLMHDRQTMGTFHAGRQNATPKTFRRVPFAMGQEATAMVRRWSGQPFVPKEKEMLRERCHEIFEIQCAALMKRIKQLPANASLHIGVSGGLDSTLALLVAVRMCHSAGWSPSRIHGLTMPGFGTSSKTLENALKLMQSLGVSLSTIDIRPACMQVFRDLDLRPFGVELGDKSIDAFQHELEQLPEERRKDLAFENIQARMRTSFLMNRGFVLGTGDLSEQALGWSTYNGDHMSMYNVNASIPKTLVRFLVRYVAENEFEGEIRTVLLDIAETPISPELLPLGKDRTIQQSTEQSVGPYELHDFFLYHFIRTGASPRKLEFLAGHAEFSRTYEPAEIRETLETFLRRFFANQFKRSCVPDGPKVGSISLSPRGDWRMPS